MRRLWATAVSGAVLLLSAGCSTETPSAGAPTPAAPASVGAPTAAAPPTASTGASAGPDAGDVALAGNTDAICNQASKVGGNAAATYATNKKILVDAEKAKDKDLAQKAEAKAVRDVQSWAYALEDMSKLVADKAVKEALSDMSKDVVKLKGDVKKINDATFTKLSSKLDKACGKA
jgi:hypothetical protein